MKLCQKCVDAIKQMLDEGYLGGPGAVYFAPVVPESECEFWADKKIMDVQKELRGYAYQLKFNGSNPNIHKEFKKFIEGLVQP